MDIYTVARAGAIGFVAGAGLYATCSYVYSRYFKDQGTNSGSNYNAPVSKEPVDPPATPIQTIEPEPSALPITRQPLPSFDDSPAPQDSAPFPIASPPEDEWDKRMNPPRREELFEPIHTIEPESSALSIPRQPLPSFEDSPAHQDSAPLPIASPPAPLPILIFRQTDVWPFPITRQPPDSPPRQTHGCPNEYEIIEDEETIEPSECFCTKFFGRFIRWFYPK